MSDPEWDKPTSWGILSEAASDLLQQPEQPKLDGGSGADSRPHVHAEELFAEASRRGRAIGDCAPGPGSNDNVVYCDELNVAVIT
jgi:hypothetical protein